MACTDPFGGLGAGGTKGERAFRSREALGRADFERVSFALQGLPTQGHKPLVRI